MRISSTKRWLAVAMSVARVGARPGPSAVTFDDAYFTGFGLDGSNGLPILVLTEAGPQAFPRTFAWTTTDPNITIPEVRLYVFNEDTKEPEEPIASVTAHGQANPGQEPGAIHTPPAISPTSTTKTNGVMHEFEMPDTSKAESAAPTVKRRAGVSGPIREQEKINMDINSIQGLGSVTIANVHQLDKYHGRQLYLGASWPNNMGETFSRAFTVVRTWEEFSVVSQTRAFLVSSPVQPEVINDISTTSTPSATAPTTNLPNGMLPTGGSNSATEASNEGGLSTGTVIGIAVACSVLGLLLVGLGVWFLIRRRNKQANSNHQPLVSSDGPYGAHRSRTDDLIAEKEASAGSADPSPHSPYSDDGVGLPGVAVGSAATAATAPILHQQIPRLPQPHDQHGRSYTPYSDRGSINGGVGGGGVVGGGSPSTHAASIVRSPSGGAGEEAARGAMGSPTAGRSTPHSSLAPRYAHLVEEGMTEDEIRRLEDEERQLDADIAEARQR